ncbi:hypothetical protein [Nocardia brasiliensis]|uniref:hypothetical protein n=1 Tax=Nocardia brasiliensis TaxID=37326 RepID=UPI00366DAFB0
MFIAAGLLGASALGYSLVGAPQPIAAAANGTAYTCDIPETDVSFTYQAEEGAAGYYEFEVPEMKLSGESEKCDKLDAATLTVEDDRAKYNEQGKTCEMKVSGIADPDNKFKNGTGTVKAAVGGGESTATATADTTEKSDQGEGSAKLDVEFKGLKVKECAAGGIGGEVGEKVTVTITGGTVEFAPKKADS